MSRPAIILDVDSVLLEYLATFADWMERRGAPAKVSHRAETDWSLCNMFPDLGPDRIFAEIRALAEHPMYGEMGFVEGAVEAVEALRAAHPGTPVVAVTAAGAHPETAVMRRRNLASLPLDEILVLPVGASKAQAFTRFPRGSVVVDDLARHVAEAEAAGHHGVLFTQPYNRHEPARIRVCGWADARRTVSELIAEPESAPSRRDLAVLR